MDNDSAELLKLISLRMQIGDIVNRGVNISLWRVSFVAENGRQPTKEDCNKAVAELQSEIDVIEKSRKDRENAERSN